MKNFLKKLFTIILFAGVYFVLERYVKIPTAFKFIPFSYAHPTVSFASVINGPFIGAISSGLGELLTMIGKESIDWPAVFCALLNCASIGFSMAKNKISDGFFFRKEQLRFAVSQMISNIGCWAVLYPILSKIFMHTDFQSAFNYGFGKAIGMSITNLIAGTLFLSLYARTRISAGNFYRS